MSNLTREDIIPSRTDVLSMAREAGFEPEAVLEGPYATYAKEWLNNMQRFAALVAAAEREACAKLVEESSLPDAYSEPALLEIANDIRARGRA